MKRLDLTYVAYAAIAILVCVGAYMLLQRPRGIVLLAPGTISVTFINRDTTQPLANTNIRVHVPGAVQCIQAPCPQPDISKIKPWNGTTDAYGQVAIPDSVVRETTTFTVGDDPQHPHYASVKREPGVSNYTAPVVLP